MENITKITVKGKEYLIRDNEAQIVIKELLNRIAELEEKTAEAKEASDFTEGSIFAGVLNETDADTPITYSFLTSQLINDSVNNKVFANTDKSVKVRYSWLSKRYGEPLKTFLLLIPANHKNLYSLTTSCQGFTFGDRDYKLITLDFPTSSMQYKVYQFCNWLVSCNQEISYNF